MTDNDPKEPPVPPTGPDEGDAEAEAEAKAKAAAAAKAKAEAAARAKAEREAAEAAKPAWERDPVAPETVDAADDPLVEALRAAHGDAVAAAAIRAGDLTLEIERSAIGEVAASLERDHGYRLMVDVCGVHYPQREEAPLEVVYHVFNIDRNRRVRLRVRAAEGEEVPTVSHVWTGANWPEREAYDMYGMRFAGHPDMTRILLWEGFNGHPLRKDFPVEGIDTGAAIYPEYYEEEAGPVKGTGTGWKPQPPPEPPPAPSETGAESADQPPADSPGEG